MNRFIKKILIYIFLCLSLKTNTRVHTENQTTIKTIFDLLINIGNTFYNEQNDGKPLRRLDCPLCDSSVYSYCSDKLLHDACCCLNPYKNKLPQLCKIADCDFLHANSCHEHKLITACCCTKIYKINSFT